MKTHSKLTQAILFFTVLFLIAVIVTVLLNYNNHLSPFELGRSIGTILKQMFKVLAVIAFIALAVRYSRKRI